MALYIKKDSLKSKRFYNIVKYYTNKLKNRPKIKKLKSMFKKICFQMSFKNVYQTTRS